MVCELYAKERNKLSEIYTLVLSLIFCYFCKGHLATLTNGFKFTLTAKEIA